MAIQWQSGVIQWQTMRRSGVSRSSGSSEIPKLRNFLEAVGAPKLRTFLEVPEVPKLRKFWKLEDP